MIQIVVREGEIGLNKQNRKGKKMPNWCNNRISIDGDKDKIQEVVDFVKGKDEEGKEVIFDLNKIVPMPEELLNPIAPKSLKELDTRTEFKKKYGFDNWYDWRVAKWGTNWNAQDSYYMGDGVFCFDTAWAPPEQAIIKLGELFPDVKITLEYFESGMCFAGILVMEGGELKEDYTSEDKSDECFQRIASSFGYEDFEDEE